MSKLNCWDYFKCGQGPGCSKSKGQAICPSVSSTAFHGYNEGKNAGRYCWHVNGTFADKPVCQIVSPFISNCIDCQFFKKVKNEEGLIFRI